MNKKRLAIVSIIVLIIIVAGICLVIFRPKKTSEKMNLKFESRVDELSKFDSGDFYKFGWLQVQGTNIDLPILDSSSITAELDYSYGWDSALYMHNQKYQVLLGHNIINVSSEPMMPNDTLSDFEPLMAFVYYDFAKNNLYAQYTQDDSDDIYLIYSIGFSNYIDNEYTNLNTKERRKEYIKEAKENSIYDYDIDVNADDELLKIETCTRMFGTEYNQQLSVNLRKLRKGESINKYSVKKNKNYKQIQSSKEKM